jgi:hypothetical protein
VARRLVVAFRVLAVLAAIWGFWNVVNTAETAFAVVAMTNQASTPPGASGHAPDSALHEAAKAARTMAIFTAVLVSLLAVAVPLFMAEVLNLTITMESNTRSAAQRLVPTQSAQVAQPRDDS